MRALILAASLALSACTTFRTIPGPSTHDVLKSVEVGQTVLLTVRDGRRFRFEVTALGEDELLGVRKGQTVRIAYSMIASIDVEERVFMPSLLIAGGALYLVYSLLGVALIVALASLG